MNLSPVFMALVIVLTSIGQVLLKIGSRHGGTRDPLGPYLNKATLSGYCLYLVSTVFMLYALQEIPLKLFAALSSLEYVLVLFLSVFILGEPAHKYKIIAVFIIMGGVLIFNL